MRLNVLKLYRMRAGLTQQALAERLGVSESLIAKYETERLKPTPEMLERIGEVLAISADRLRRLEGHKE